MENGIQNETFKQSKKKKKLFVVATIGITVGLCVLVKLLSPACNGAVIDGVRYLTETNETYAYCSSEFNASGDIEILPSIDGTPVKNVQVGSYSASTHITSISFPDSVEYIDGFNLCTSLEKIEFPNNDFSFYGSFSDCISLRSVNIPDTWSYMPSFENCASLTSINIPYGVTEIGDRTFSGCSSLTSIEIPDSVTMIGESAFSGCTSLTSVNIPDGVTTIEAGTFSNCTSLSSITIPDGVTELDGDIFGVGAFTGCTSLASVRIPDSVTDIGAFTFADCTSLTSVYIPDSVTYLDGTAFSLCDQLTSVSVPSYTDISISSFYTDEAYTWMTAVDRR